MVRIIEHKGKTFKTNVEPWIDITDEKWEELKEMYYRKPPIEKVIKQMRKLHIDGVKFNHITQYYLRELMCDAKTKRERWTINEMFECKDLVEYFYSRTFLNQKFRERGDHASFKAVLELGGRTVAQKVPNYPITTVREILDRYNVNNNYYDYSCGWGVRLLGSLNKEINYYGTDPNYKLTNVLNEIASLYKEVNNLDTIVDIRTQGSEHFISEWENTIGVAFSCPPYFDLEDYKHGEQSINYGGYDNWIEFYLRPTFLNIKKYLVSNGYFIINIKNIEGYNLVDDSIKIANECGFKLHEELLLTQTHRHHGAGGKKAMNSKEPILVFVKDGE